MPAPSRLRRGSTGVLLALAALLVLATLLPIVPHDAWWVRVFDYPRLQIAGAGALVLALYAALRQRGRPAADGLMAALLLAVGYQAVTIVPYTPLVEPEVVVTGDAEPEATLSLLVANVLMENRESARFLDIVRAYDPDLVLTLEPDAWWEGRLRALEAEYPHALKRPLDNTYGMVLHSRLPLLDARVKELVEDSIPSMHAAVRLPSGHRVQLHFLHPDPPNPAYATRTTERDGELLLVGREVRQHGRPTVVAGDLNDVAWSRTTRLFQETSGLLDPRVGRGTYSTFHAGIPLLRWPLDHVFHSDHFTLVRLERGPAFGSDHFPIYAEIAVDPEAEWLQDAPAPSAEEVEEATEAIREADPQEGL